MFRKTDLKNNLRVITVPQPASLTATVLVLVEAGSKYETREINGLSHFLEHMCFKGTAKRPTAFHISAELDGLGAEYNAFTGMEYTGYYAKVESRRLDKILDIVSDMYLNPVFKAEEIEKERGVIIEEINMYEDLPMRKVGELFTALLYGDQPAGWDIAGTKENIRRLKREDFVEYRGSHYLPGSTVIVVAGNFSEDSAISEIEQAFRNMPDGAKNGKDKTMEQQEKPAVLLKTKKSDQTHLVLGVRAFNIFDERKYPLQVLSDILGGGMSSRLFQKVREELGAAYYVKAGADLFTDHGYLAVSAGIDHAKIEAVVKAVLEEFNRFAREAVGAKELQRAKDHLIGQFAISLEGSDDLANFYGGMEILERNIVPPEDVVKKIRAVTAEEIQEVAREIFRNEKLNLAMISPFEDKEKLERILTPS